VFFYIVIGVVVNVLDVVVVNGVALVVVVFNVVFVVYVLYWLLYYLLHIACSFGATISNHPGRFIIISYFVFLALCAGVPFIKIDTRENIWLVVVVVVVGVLLL